MSIESKLTDIFRSNGLSYWANVEISRSGFASAEVRGEQLLNIWNSSRRMPNPYNLDDSLCGVHSVDDSAWLTDHFTDSRVTELRYHSPRLWKIRQPFHSLKEALDESLRCREIILRDKATMSLRSSFALGDHFSLKAIP